eukprot:3017102-Alexandrium_andersonii.AAC.1
MPALPCGRRFFFTRQKVKGKTEGWGRSVKKLPWPPQGGCRPPGPPRLAPPARAASPGGLPPPPDPPKSASG